MQRRSEEMNAVRLRGTIYRSPRFTHEFRGQSYYLMYLAVPRLSGVLDILPVTVPGCLYKEDMPRDCGQWVEVEGQMRSYNRQDESRRRLIVTLYARNISSCDAAEGAENRVELGGYLCRSPLYRTTPLRRQIADLMVAVNRPYRGSDYLPVIVWGQAAKMAENYRVGSFLHLCGRFQSREYNKTQENGFSCVRVAYEISAVSLRMGENCE